MHRANYPFGTAELSQEVASALPNAELIALSPETLEEAEQLFVAVDAFLRATGEVPGRLAQLGARSPHASGLTPREVEVLRLIACGRTNREISEDLVLSVRTVARHIANIYAKIDARSKADATAYAIRQGLS
jgi:DNA-binding NarL/FixJ family response regulator